MGGGFPLIIIIAAVAGVLLIAVVLLIACRGKKDRVSRDSSSMSFENPMYDSTGLEKANPAFEGAYDDVHPGNELYDEPAIGSGGYLDVENEDGGYLDVAEDDEEKDSDDE